MAYTDIISISQLLDFFHYEKPKHPLIAVVDLSKVDRSHRQQGPRTAWTYILLPAKK